MHDRTKEALQFFSSALIAMLGLGGICMAQGSDRTVITAGDLKVVYDAAADCFGAWSGNEKFISRGSLRQKGGSAHVVSIESRTGAAPGKAIVVQYKDGGSDEIAIYEDSQFVFCTAHFNNNTSQAVTIDKITTVSALSDLNATSGQLKVLGCDGLTDPHDDRISFSFLAAAHPQTRAGVVAGWLTHHRGSGIVLSHSEQGRLQIDGRVEYGRLRIEAGRSADGETFVIGYFGDARDGLEGYADLAAVYNDVKLNPVPCGYCTWYSSPNGGASDETHMAELADFCRANLTDFGFNVLQIDDRWQISNRDFTTHKPNGPYPSGMKKTADKVAACGMTAGLWYIPFGWDPGRDIFKDHQDWFVKTAAGEPYAVHWAGTCLDMTHPEARGFLSEVVSRMSREWGYKYMKIDGLWTGLAAKITYPSPEYKEDNLGDAVFHDASKTNLEAYRDGLKLVREAAGDDVFVLGCNIAQNMRTLGASFGLVDGMRVGRDIGAAWSHILPCVDMGSRLYFFHGRVWYNDPDCLMLRAPLALDEARAWASWISITGDLNLVSEWLPGLPPERLDIVKRSMPNHGLCARPVDLFGNERPAIWQLTDTRTNQRRDVVALFNWDDKKLQTISVPIDKLDLPASVDGKYVGFEYWTQRYVEPFADKLEMSIAAGACAIIVVRPALDRPLLLSTSRHITQGIVDVLEETWDPATQTLTGRSKVVANDPYQLRFAVPDNDWLVESSAFRGGRTPSARKLERDGLLWALNVTCAESGIVQWRIRFRKTDHGLAWPVPQKGSLTDYE